MNLGGEMSASVDLRAYLHALWQRRVAAFLCLGLVVGTAMFISYRRTPEFRATSQILLKAPLRDLIAGNGSSSYVDPVRTQKTEIQIINSPTVFSEVAKKIGPYGGVTVRPLPDTDILLVDAVDRDRIRAAEVANAVVDTYVALRQSQAVAELEAAGTAVQSRITEIEKQIDALPQPAAPAPTGAGAVTTTTLRSAANTQFEALNSQLTLLKQKLSDIRVESSLNSGGAQVVALAFPPDEPFAPNHRRDAILALGVGLVFGVGVALLWEFLDDSIDSKEELARLVPDTPVLAAVPPVKAWKDRGKPLVVSLTDEGSPAAEAYKSLRTSIHFSRLEQQQLSLIQVTSASAAEGKTSTVANLGVALARAGNRVVIVCCDLRRPRIHQFFGLSNKVGFVSVLVGESTLSTAIQPVPNQPRLALLAAGPPPPNPSELLSSRRAADVFAALRKNADIVLIDCPPLLPVTDAVVLSEKVDATLLVVNAGTTTRRRLHHAVDLLHQVNAPVIGMVLNGAATDGGYGYTYVPVPQKPPAAKRAKAGPAVRHVPVDTGFDSGTGNGNGNGSPGGNGGGGRAVGKGPALPRPRPDADPPPRSTS